MSCLNCHNFFGNPKTNNLCSCCFYGGYPCKGCDKRSPTASPSSFCSDCLNILKEYYRKNSWNILNKQEFQDFLLNIKNINFQNSYHLYFYLLKNRIRLEDDQSVNDYRITNIFNIQPWKHTSFICFDLKRPKIDELETNQNNPILLYPYSVLKNSYSDVYSNNIHSKCFNCNEELINEEKGSPKFCVICFEVVCDDCSKKMKNVKCKDCLIKNQNIQNIRKLKDINFNFK